MKRILSIVWLLVLAPLSAHAADYKSTFGFPFTLSDDWVVMQPGTVASQFKQQTLESMGLTQMDQKTAKAALDRVKSGKVEYYFEKKYSSKHFNNNLSTAIMAGGGMPTPANVAELCPTLPAGLAKVQGAPVKLKVCRFDVSHGIPYVIIEYTVPSRGINIIQHQIPFLAHADFQLIGGSNDAGLDTVRAAADAMTGNITQYISRVWQAKLPSARQRTAMVRDAMHHFALSVNARDFTGFYGYIAQAWQRNTTAAQLAATYKGFSDAQINLLPLDKVKPHIELVHDQGGKGVFLVKGYYPSRPLRVSFEFGYLYEPPNWKLVTASVQAKSVHEKKKSKHKSSKGTGGK